MAKIKTTQTENSVIEFINNVENEVKRNDSFKLIEIFKSITGHNPKMWGPSIIGFGSYHYKYESGHEGDAPIVGFSPRKAEFSLYAFTGLEEDKHLLQDLGRIKVAKACIYFKKLSDINQNELKKLIKASISNTQNKYGKQV